MQLRSKSYNKSSPKWTSILKALADENRLQIIHELLRHELTVRDLSNTLNMKDYNLSKHLKILEAIRVSKKEKRWCSQDIPYYGKFQFTSVQKQSGTGSGMLQVYF